MGNTPSNITSEYTQYNRLLKNKEHVLKTLRGTYLVYKWDQDTFHTYPIEYKKDGIMVDMEPMFFNKKGETIGKITVIFKRDDGNINHLKVTKIKSSYLYVAWYPFVIKRIRENLNNDLKRTVQKELELVKKIAHNDSIQLAQNDPFYLVPGNKLHSDKKWCIYEEEELVSENGIYHLNMQCDGNLVAYKKVTPYWASNTRNDKKIENWTKNRQKYSLRLQMNGLLVIYNSNKGKVAKVLNNKEEHLANRPFILTLQNDGNLVLKNKNDETIWSIK